MSERKPLLCRVGLHELFCDTVLRNYGTKEMPLYFGETYKTCGRCGWSTRPKGAI